MNKSLINWMVYTEKREVRRNERKNKKNKKQYKGVSEIGRYCINFFLHILAFHNEPLL